MYNANIPIIKLCIVGCLFASVYRLIVKPELVKRSSRNFVDLLTLRFSRAGFEYERSSVKNLFLMGNLILAIVGSVLSKVTVLVFPIAGSLILWFVLGRLGVAQKLKVQKVNDELCYFLARSLRAGSSLDTALLQAHLRFPNSQIVNKIVSQVAAGRSTVKALNQVVNDKSFDISNSERMFCATISIASEMGGNSARVFERIGDTFYQNYELKADTGAALAQVKISTVVIGLLPVGMLLFSLILGSDATSFLFTNPIGLVCLILGGSLEIIGVCWMRLLVQRGVGIWTS